MLGDGEHHPGTDGCGDPGAAVTVSFTPRADPAPTVEMTAWIRAGLRPVPVAPPRWKQAVTIWPRPAR